MLTSTRYCALGLLLLAVLFSSVSQGATYLVPENTSSAHNMYGASTDTAILFLSELTAVQIVFYNNPAISSTGVESASISDFTVLANDAGFSELITASAYIYTAVLGAGLYTFDVSGEGDGWGGSFGTYTVTGLFTAIPLPAGVWLLVSALLGFSIVSRRKLEAV